MQNSQTTHQAYADEISLLELWQILTKRKALVFVTFFICILGGSGYAFLKPPIFEASVKLRIGQVAVDQPGSTGLLENADELASRLLAHFGEDVADGIKRERPFLARAAAQKGLTTTVDLVVEGDTPDEAADLLKRIVSDIEATHSATYQRNVQFLNERLENLDLQRGALQKQYHDATALLEQLKQRDAVQASLIMLERGRISTSISELDAEKPALTQKLVPPQTRPTELLGEITAPTKAAKPKKTLVIALAATLGLMGGVMLAFVAEFAIRAKKAPAKIA